MDYAKEYGDIHENQKLYAGTTIRRHVARIAELVAEHNPRRMLDYGSGKGFQYLVHRVHEAWGGPLPYLYDVGVRQLAGRPKGLFGGIVCTDVMEHIETQDVDAILADIASFAESRAFIFLAISCIPAKARTLSDGRNVHVTLQPPEWWEKRLDTIRRPGLVVDACYEVA